MKISIDTATDSPHAIKKAMDLLHYLANNPTTKNTLDQKPVATAASLAQEQTQELNAGFASMFADPVQNKETTSTQQTSDTAPNFGSFLNLMNGEQNKDTTDPKIEFF